MSASLRELINKHRLSRATYLAAPDDEADDLGPGESADLRAVLFYQCRTEAELHEKLDYLRDELPTDWFAPTIGCCGGYTDEFLKSIDVREAA